MDHFNTVRGLVLAKVSSWRGAPAVEVVRGMRDVPEAPAFDIRGSWSPAGVMVVAETQPVHKVIATLHHEAIGHGGVRAVLGRGWKSFMTAVLDGRTAGDESLRLAADMVNEVYADEYGSPALTRISLADEMVAAMTEWATCMHTGSIVVDSPVRKQVKAAASHLAREVLLLDFPADRDQVEGTILLAEHHVRHGGLCFGIARWYHSRMTKPMGPRVPPRDWAESQQWLEAERYREGWWDRTKETLGFLFIIGSVIGMVWWFFAMLWLIFR